jgi:hypothetical protein
MHFLICGEFFLKVNLDVNSDFTGDWEVVGKMGDKRKLDNQYKNK